VHSTPRIFNIHAYIIAVKSYEDIKGGEAGRMISTAGYLSVIFRHAANVTVFVINSCTRQQDS